MRPKGSAGSSFALLRLDVRPRSLFRLTVRQFSFAFARATNFDTLNVQRMHMKALTPMLVAGFIFAAAGTSSAANVGMIEVRSSITPVTEAYISRAISVAERQNDACLIIELDTPGGLLDSTRKI